MQKVQLTAYGQDRLEHYQRVVMRVLTVAAMAGVVIGLGAIAALAQVKEPLPVTPVSSLATIPYGEWIAPLLDLISEIAFPILVAFLIRFIWKIFPLARMFLTEELIERALQKYRDYAINEVGGAMRGKTLTVDLAVPVIASAVTRALSRANVSRFGQWVLNEAGGVDELARKLFRLLPLEESATSKTVVEPALRRVEAMPSAVVGNAGRRTGKRL